MDKNFKITLQILQVLDRFRQLQFAFNFPSSPVTRPTVYNAKEISRKKFHLFGKLCKIRLAKFQFSFNFPSLMWVTYDGYNHGVAWRRSWFRRVVWWGSLPWNIGEGCKSPLIFTDKMTLFLAHTLFPELLYLQELPFVPGAQNKMYKFLDIVALMKGNRAKHLEFTASIWSSEIAQRLTFFNLKSCTSKWQFVTRQLKRTTETFAIIRLLQTWRSVAILAFRRHVCDTCSYLLQNLRKRIEFCRNACVRCSPALQWCWMRQISRTGAAQNWCSDKYLETREVEIFLFRRVQIVPRNRDNTFIRKFIASV